ncbi:MAG: hypothetical protein AB8B87_26360 [Granulosicoccus sp.]
MVMIIYPDAHILDVAGAIEILTGTRLFVEQVWSANIVTALLLLYFLRIELASAKLK